MRFLLLLLFSIQSFLSYTQDSILIDSLGNDLDSLFSHSSRGLVTSYSGNSKNMTMHGMSFTYNNGITRKATYNLDNPEYEYLFLRGTKLYYNDGTLKLDSLLDFTKRKKATQKVIHYYPNGKKKSKKILSVQLNPQRNSVPDRSELFWNGKMVRFKNRSRKKTTLIRYLS